MMTLPTFVSTTMRSADASTNITPAFLAAIRLTSRLGFLNLTLWSFSDGICQHRCRESGGPEVRPVAWRAVAALEGETDRPRPTHSLQIGSVRGVVSVTTILLGYSTSPENRIPGMSCPAFSMVPFDPPMTEARHRFRRPALGWSTEGTLDLQGEFTLWVRPGSRVHRLSEGRPGQKGTVEDGDAGGAPRSPQGTRQTSKALRPSRAARAHSLVRLEHPADNREVAGSNPAGPMTPFSKTRLG